jgi:hypothetical protein
MLIDVQNVKKKAAIISGKDKNKLIDWILYYVGKK